MGLATKNYADIAAFQPVVNGVGGNLVAIFGKISFHLYFFFIELDNLNLDFFSVQTVHGFAPHQHSGI